MNPGRQVDNLESFPLEERAVTPASAPGGNRTHIAPVRGCRVTAGMADHRTSEGVLTDTGGSRTHKPRGLRPVAIPVRVPCQNRLPSQEPPVGVEPTLPPYQDGWLPLQHGGVTNRAPGGGRTRATDLARRRAPINTTGASFRHHPSSFILHPFKEHPAGLEPASPSWEGGMFPLHHGCASFSGTRRTRTSTRGIKSPGCCR